MCVPIKMLFVGLLVLVGFAAAQAQSEPSFKVGDRVEVKKFREWKSGKVTEVNARFERLTVLLDEPDISPAAAARLPKEALLQLRQTRVSFRDARHLDGAPEAPAPSEAKPRLWTSSNGKFKVQATFRGLKDDKVTLEKADGEQIEVALNLLSEADVAYARGAAAPKRVTVPPRGSGGGDSGGANWSGVKTIQPQTFARWTFRPQPTRAPAAVKPPGPAVLQDIPDSDRFFEKVLSLRVADDGSRAIVVREKGKLGSDEVFVQSVDLKLGKAEPHIALPKETALLDADAGSGRIMYRPDVFGFGNRIDLTIAQLDGAKLTRLASWRPYENADRDPKKDIDQGWFLGDEKVMTINRSGDALTIWDVNAARALFNIPVKTSVGLKVGLSPDRTLLVMAAGDGLALINLAEGVHCASLPTPQAGDFNAFAFRADNGRLAARSPAGVTIWDLTNGEAIRQLAHPVIDRRGEIAWGGDYLLVDKQFLFDVDRRVLLWQYDNASRLDAAEYRGGRLHYVTDASREAASRVGSAEIPHPAAVAMARSLGTPESLLVAKRGDAVKIELDIDPRVGDAASVRAAIEKNLQATGLRVSDNASLVLRGVCKPQKSESLKINTGDRLRPKIVERTITPHASFLELTLNDQSLFKRGHLAQPGMTIWLE